ncbi:MAG: hypothetical protein M5U28_19645 [Sandaracinaceae bacterium]|nr:hypothetical protein [Sandaracinaceae bacterium]
MGDDDVDQPVGRVRRRDAWHGAGRGQRDLVDRAPPRVDRSRALLPFVRGERPRELLVVARDARERERAVQRIDRLGLVACRHRANAAPPRVLSQRNCTAGARRALSASRHGRALTMSDAGSPPLAYPGPVSSVRRCCACSSRVVRRADGSCPACGHTPSAGQQERGGEPSGPAPARWVVLVRRGLAAEQPTHGAAAPRRPLVPPERCACCGTRARTSRVAVPASGRRGASFQLRACASCVSHVRRDPVPFLLRALMWTAVTAAAIVGRAGGGGARAAVIASAVALVVLVVALEVRGRRPLPVPAASEGEHRGAAGVRDVGGDRATYVVGSCHHDWLDDLVEINADAYDAVHASSEPQALAAARDASLRHVVAGNAAPGAAPHASTLDLPAVKAFAAAELQPAIGSGGVGAGPAREHLGGRAVRDLAGDRRDVRARRAGARPLPRG